MKAFIQSVISALEAITDIDQVSFGTPTVSTGTVAELQAARSSREFVNFATADATLGIQITIKAKPELSDWLAFADLLETVTARLDGLGKDTWVSEREIQAGPPFVATLEVVQRQDEDIAQ